MRYSEKNNGWPSSAGSVNGEYLILSVASGGKTYEITGVAIASTPIDICPSSIFSELTMLPINSWVRIIIFIQIYAQVRLLLKPDTLILCSVYP